MQTHNITGPVEEFATRKIAYNSPKTCGSSPNVDVRKINRLPVPSDIAHK